MGDPQLRQLYRACRDPGGVENEAAYLRELVRTGGLAHEWLEVAAAAGSRAAKLALSESSERLEELANSREDAQSWTVLLSVLSPTAPLIASAGAIRDCYSRGARCHGKTLLAGPGHADLNSYLDSVVAGNLQEALLKIPSLSDRALSSADDSREAELGYLLGGVEELSRALRAFFQGDLRRSRVGCGDSVRLALGLVSQLQEEGGCSDEDPDRLLIQVASTHLRSFVARLAGLDRLSPDQP